MHLITTVQMMSGRLLKQGKSLLYLVPFIENRQHFCYCEALGKSKELNPEEVNFQGGRENGESSREHPRRKQESEICRKETNLRFCCYPHACREIPEVKIWSKV